MKTRSFVTRSLAALAIALTAAPALAADGDIVMDSALVIARVSQGGRVPVHIDPVERRIVRGNWSIPSEGDTVKRPNGNDATWTRLEAEDGWLRDAGKFRGGYALWTVDMPAEAMMTLIARGHGLVYVNGEPRVGDPYNTGWVRIPVRLRAGTNEFLFRGSRGGIRAMLRKPASEASINARDATLPHVIRGEPWATRGAVIITNNTRATLDGLRLSTSGGGYPTRETDVPPLPPFAMRKVPFALGGAIAPDRRSSRVDLELTQLSAAGVRRTLDATTLAIGARGPNERHKRTFTSGIDGSLQYYGVTPANAAPGDPTPGLILTLHGASVEAMRQASVYKPKPWAHVVAPTNRRPFGFDWEDWGRLDAIEVLELNQERLGTDPQRTWLTGHSMGGHGTWHIGVTFPDRFAALGPSAGWISFWSYTGAASYDDGTPMESILRRATSPSDTLALSRNYLQQGVYILHGDKDDNVPADQARTMNEHLGGYHEDFTYHEEPGAGHWWGDRCCDWPPMMEFLSARTIPTAGEVDHVEFHTASPRVSAWSHWAGVIDQVEPLVPSAVDLKCNPNQRRFRGTVENVAVLSLRLDHLPAGNTVDVILDGENITMSDLPDECEQVWLTLDPGTATWSGSAERPDPARKGPHRFGPFKDAFRNRMVFVYGTAGDADENAWSYAKARFDAETFWYRGNGSVDVIADVDVDLAALKDRNIILYGNAATNAAWDPLLADAPVRVNRNQVRVGENRLRDDDLACLFIYPRPDSETACVGVVGGTTLAGCRLTDRLPYFVSGVGYPDLMVLGVDTLRNGIGGIRAAGFFESDWTVGDDFAWGER